MKWNAKPKKLSTRIAIGFFACLFDLCLIAGCAQHPSEPIAHQTTQQSLISCLEAQKVQVFHWGATYRLVIPSNQLFYPGAANFCEGASTLLKTVARLLNHYRVVTVKVVAYLDSIRKAPLHYALTEQQAAAVQAYLSNCGIGVRFIYAVGRGGEHPVAAHHTSISRAMNRRVEISFQYLPGMTSISQQAGSC